MQELQAVVFVQKASGRGITGFAEILRLSSGLMCTESCLATHCRALMFIRGNRHALLKM